MTAESDKEYKTIINNSSSSTTCPFIYYDEKNSKTIIEKNFSSQQEKQLNVVNNGNEVNSTGKGIYHQILVTGAILILAAACGMPIGYSAVILPQLYNSSESKLKINVEMGSWIASVHSLATPFGSFASGPIADRFGRRPALLLSIFPLIIGWSLIAISKSYAFLIIGRIIAGFAVGLIGAPAQILIAEIAIPRIRGILIGAPFVSYSLGILFVYALGSNLHWRNVAWCGNILPILSGIALLLIPESPVWLARKGYIDKAQKALNWLRGDCLQAKQELNILINRFEDEKSLASSKDNFLRMCCTRSSLKPLILINIFFLLQILSGTFLIVFYAVDILSEFGGDIDTKSAAVMTAIVRLICTIIFCFLLLITQRRHMVIISGIGSGLSSLMLGIYIYMRNGQPKTSTEMYFPAFCILSYIAFNTGFMVMPGIMIGELLPTKIRGRIAGFIFAAFNISLFVIAKIFPIIQFYLKTYGLFLMFAAASFIASIYMFIFLPETKGRTLGQIEDYFSKSNWLWLNRIDKKVSSKNDIDSNCEVDKQNVQ